MDAGVIIDQRSGKGDGRTGMGSSRYGAVGVIGVSKADHKAGYVMVGRMTVRAGRAHW